MPNDFKRVFQDALDEIESGAKEAGISMMTVCTESGVSRTTPNRWKRRVPKTVQILADMQAIVERAKSDKSAAQAAGETSETI